MEKRIEIRTSELIEYANLMARMALDPELKTESLMAQNLYEVRDATDQCLTALIRNDIAYFSGGLMLHQLACDKATYHGMSGVHEFIEAIRDMTWEELLIDYLDALVEYPYREDLEGLEEALKEDQFLQSMNFSFEVLEEFIEEAESLLDRVVQYFDLFYKKVFLPNRDRVMEASLACKKGLDRWLDKDYEGFVRVLIKVNMETYLGGESDYRAILYPCVTYPNNVGYHIREDRPWIMHVVIGSHVEEMFKSAASEALLRYLGDSTKMMIIKMLTGKTMYASEVAAELKLNRATISHHLMQLTKVNAVGIAYTKGNKVFYETKPDQIEAGLERFVDRLKQLEGERK